MSTPTPGRRVAQRQRQRPRLDRGAITGLALVAVAGALLATAGVVDADPEPVGAPETVAVDQVAMACLGSPEAGSSRAVTFAAPVPQAEAPLTERSWKDYVRALATDTNNSSEVLSSPESTAELSITSLLGWPTREVLFRKSSAQPGHFTIERELLASDGQQALLFRLTASEADHALASADLDFFIARLELL